MLTFYIFLQRLLPKKKKIGMEAVDIFNLIENEAEIETMVCDVTECNKQINLVKTYKSLNILHLNIRSINKNFDELLILLETLKQNVDIIILSETWQINSTKYLNIPDFTIHYNHSKLNQNDGMIIYLRNKIMGKVEQVSYNTVNISRTAFIFNDNNICITSIYRSPSSDPIAFLSDLEAYYKTKETHSMIEILVGDINLNILQKNDAVINDYLNLLGGMGFTSYINKPTRVTEQTSTCIDHIFVKKQNNSKLFCKSMILEYNITDHFPTLLNIYAENKAEQKSYTHVISKLNEKKTNRFIGERNVGFGVFHL